MRRLLRQITSFVREFITPVGRHRARRALSEAPRHTPPTGPPHTPIAPTVRTWYEPIDGATTPLVRPYLHAYEHDEKTRLQRLRREALWYATYGIDLDTRDIHNWLEAA
jgi:hypothetical protein